MQVGDLVKIIAPESIVGWPAGHIGVITEKLDDDIPPDYIVTITRRSKLEQVYVHHEEIKVLYESR